MKIYELVKEMIFYVIITLNALAVLVCASCFLGFQDVPDGVIHKYHVANNCGDQDKYIYVLSYEFSSEKAAERMQKRLQ